MLEALTATVTRAAELFTELLPDRGPVRSVTRFAEGSITGAYRIDFASTDPADAADPADATDPADTAHPPGSSDTTSAPVVLKIYESDVLGWAVRELRALRFLTDHGIDVSPRALAFSTSAAALGGRPCVVTEFRPGRTLSDMGDELTDTQRHEVYRQLGEVLRRLHAVPADGYGYVDGEIREPLPDNSAHMARIFERESRLFRKNAGDPALADKLTAHVAERASAFADCLQPVYCHGDVHDPNLLAEVTADGTCRLTGLLDPGNLHAGDPLVEFVRLDAFSLYGDETKVAGLLAGYGVSASEHARGQWPDAWRPRMALYRIALALELYNWFTFTGDAHHLPGLERELRDLLTQGERSGV